ncbi:hypothetical protein L873DRAFT_644023 [Choiromyces venosus 120613-1]|uniref:Uncharacterized protein n=1 Tax=Choiromyces venosus 120613-1 TaxID=1336337 RepID=A0A3N4JTX6_9PEZI|nr:hypothetical protein L873DRAFT_644023 [Choiromyces venosus 120613-1]
MEQWTEVVMNLCEECKDHRSRPSRTSGGELARFLRTVPCQYCPDLTLDGVSEQDQEGESTGVLDYAPRSNIQSNAMEDLAKEKPQDHIENIRCKFYELASGNWDGQNNTLDRAQWNNGLSYPIPIFKTFYTTEHFILWQIDTAFDERLGNDYQVIKVWAIGKPVEGELERIGVQIYRAQQIYTNAHVKACGIDGLNRSGETKYPERVYLDGRKKGGLEVDEIEDSGFDDLAQLVISKVLWSQCNCSG